MKCDSIAKNKKKKNKNIVISSYQKQNIFTVGEGLFLRCEYIFVMDWFQNKDNKIEFLSVQYRLI